MASLQHGDRCLRNGGAGPAGLARLLPRRISLSGSGKRIEAGSALS